MRRGGGGVNVKVHRLFMVRICTYALYQRVTSLSMGACARKAISPHTTDLVTSRCLLRCQSVPVHNAGFENYYSLKYDSHRRQKKKKITKWILRFFYNNYLPGFNRAWSYRKFSSSLSECGKIFSNLFNESSSNNTVRCLHTASRPGRSKKKKR